MGDQREALAVVQERIAVTRAVHVETETGGKG